MVPGRTSDQQKGLKNSRNGKYVNKCKKLLISYFLIKQQAT